MKILNNIRWQNLPSSQDTNFSSLHVNGAPPLPVLRSVTKKKFFQTDEEHFTVPYITEEVTSSLKMEPCQRCRPADHLTGLSQSIAKIQLSATSLILHTDSSSEHHILFITEEHQAASVVNKIKQL
jgi:hypothetical protein